jgi:RND family efflux transporter MFP subunit
MNKITGSAGTNKNKKTSATNARIKNRKDIIYFWNKIISLCLFVVLICCSCREEQELVSTAVKVEIAKPKYMLFQDRITVHGNIEPVDYAEICARVDGVIDELNVQEGDKVKRGTILFQSDRMNLKSQVEIAKQNLNVAKSNLIKAVISQETRKIFLQKANIDYVRAKGLLERNAISKDSFERTELLWKQAGADIQSSQADVKYAQALVDQATSNVKISQKMLEDSMIKAPYDGVITVTNKKVSEYAKKGDCVLRIENPDKLEIAILLSSNYYSDIKVGKTKALIYSLEGDRLVEALVAYRAPNIDPISRTFEIKITLPKTSKLVSGMLCSITLIFSEHMGYGVPREAIMLRGENRSIVFTPAANQAKSLQVYPGISNGRYTELKNITKDLDIIVKGQAFLNADTPIKIMNKTVNGANHDTQ